MMNPPAREENNILSPRFEMTSFRLVELKALIIARENCCKGPISQRLTSELSERLTMCSYASVRSNVQWHITANIRIVYVHFQFWFAWAVHINKLCGNVVSLTHCSFPSVIPWRMIVLVRLIITQIKDYRVEEIWKLKMHWKVIYNKNVLAKEAPLRLKEI